MAEIVWVNPVGSGKATRHREMVEVAEAGAAGLATGSGSPSRTRASTLSTRSAVDLVGFGERTSSPDITSSFGADAGPGGDVAI